MWRIPGVAVAETQLVPGSGELDVLRTAVDAREAALADGMRADRAREFLTGRVLAGRAASVLGLRHRAVLRSTNGGPRWPGDRTGSITHTRRYAAAAVSLPTVTLAVGLDAEEDRSLGEDAAAFVLTRGELDHVRELQRSDGPAAWDTRIVSAKEAAFKLWSGLTGERLSPMDIDVRLGEHPDGICAAVHGTVLRGRFSVEDGLLRSWVRLPSLVPSAAENSGPAGSSPAQQWHGAPEPRQAGCSPARGEAEHTARELPAASSGVWSVPWVVSRSSVSRGTGASDGQGGSILAARDSNDVSQRSAVISRSLKAMWPSA